jgi:MFS superfamily sulfate permease-like transporter
MTQAHATPPHASPPQARPASAWRTDLLAGISVFLIALPFRMRRYKDACGSCA